jgi:hypothetical protein
MRRNNGQRGSAMLEFVLAGIAGVTLVVSTVQLGLAMWNYHTLAEAVHETNRYVASHGRNCTVGGNGCGITVADVANKMKVLAVGISDSSINMTLTSTTQEKDCYPLSNCESDTTQWPPDTNFDNTPGNYTTISAKLVVKSAIISLWYGATGSSVNSVAMTARSSVPIVF